MIDNEAIAAAWSSRSTTRSPLATSYVLITRRNNSCRPRRNEEKGGETHAVPLTLKTCSCVSSKLM